MRGWHRMRQPSLREQIEGVPVDDELALAARFDVHPFAPLYARYRDDVLRYAFYCLGEWDDAADTTQEIFANALSGLPGMTGGTDAFRRWLFRIAHNEVCDRLERRRRRATESLDRAMFVTDPSASLEHHAIVGDDHARVLDLLVRLPPDRRRVCELRFAGLTDREIAHVLDKSEGAVRTAWSRAAASLRDLMGVGLSEGDGRDAR
jgi:RNA polymerase sigma-70 factor (ECF subfamily)